MVDRITEKGKFEAEKDDKYVNDCQFEGHKAQEAMAEAKARAELTRPDVKGECETK